MKAYIFDLDGVLIDSKKMMSHAWTICQLEHNLDQPFSEYFKHIGKPFRDIMKELGIDDVEAVKHTYDKASLELMEYCLEFYDGVEDTLKELKKNNKIAVGIGFSKLLEAGSNIVPITSNKIAAKRSI